MVKTAGAKKKTIVLVAALDWGLGHATRCIPIIYELIAQSCEVWIAASGAQKELLAREFPALRFIVLPGYAPVYGPNAWRTRLRIGSGIPKMALSVRQERRWLRAFLGDNKPDAIISDNRYGLWVPEIPCVLITHQLQVRSGGGRIPDAIFSFFLKRYIRRFAACWVPDREPPDNLSGDLARADIPGMPIRYLGWLSRLGPCTQPAENLVLVMLSGPEPQRSILEALVVCDAPSFGEPLVLLRGLPLGGKRLDLPAHVRVHDHLPAAELKELLCRASLVICRSGYSSLMELVCLSKRSVLVPTPGQGEQEYLAARMQDLQVAVSLSQKEFTLDRAMENARHFSYRNLDLPGQNLLAETISDFLQQIRQKERR